MANVGASRTLLATPVSHLFADIDAARKIEAASDVLECREEHLGYRLTKEALLHLNWNLASRWNERHHQRLSQAIRERPRIEVVSFHLVSCYQDPVLNGRVLFPGHERYSRAELMALVSENTAWLKANVNPGCSLAVENVHYYPSGAYDIVSEPWFVAQAVRDNDLFLVMDVAHVRISAWNLKENLMSHVRSFPLDRLLQLHVSSPMFQKNGEMVDSHDPPDDAAWALVSSLLAEFPVRFVSIEYYRTLEVLLDQIKRFRVLMEALQNPGVSAADIRE